MFDYQIGDLLLAPFLFNVGGEKLFLEPPDSCFGSVPVVECIKEPVAAYGQKRPYKIGCARWFSFPGGRIDSVEFLQLLVQVRQPSLHGHGFFEE